MIQMNQPEALVWRMWAERKLNTYEIMIDLNRLIAVDDTQKLWTEAQVHTMIRDIRDRNYVQYERATR